MEVFNTGANHTLAIKRIKHPKSLLTNVIDIIQKFNPALYYCIFNGIKAIKPIASSISLDEIHNNVNKTKKHELSLLTNKKLLKKADLKTRK